jgi:hypothetical protein
MKTRNFMLLLLANVAASAALLFSTAPAGAAEQETLGCCRTAVGGSGFCCLGEGTPNGCTCPVLNCSSDAACNL